jgi:hypothetical protein
LKSTAGKTLFKLTSAVIGIVVIGLGASIVLTDPTPTTLPRRSWQLLLGLAAMFSPPSKPVPNPPIVNVPIAPADDAELDVRDTHFVVGVELNGESRAYSLNMLSRPDHHVVNDTLGGQPIAVTWCGLCQSPLVYSRRVDGNTLTFFVSGELYGENMVMQDQETGSDWPQLLGEAVRGPLKGKSIEQIPAVWTDWKSWRTDHPDTTLPKISQTVDYYRHDPDPLSPSLEERYFSNMQWGLARGGKSLSWPLNEIARRGVVNDELAGLPLLIVFERKSATITAFERRAGDTELTFTSNPEGLVDDQTSSLWDRLTGRAIRGALAGHRLTPVAGVVSHKRAWQSLHPESAIRSGNAN